MEKENPIKKFWSWLWNSDSLLSWIVSLVIAFVIVKFIFFPVLSLTLGSSLPLVVVESSSMEHSKTLAGTLTGNIIGSENSFELWWEEEGSWYQNKGITKEQAREWHLHSGFDKGDIMIVWGRDKEPEIGDVIIFNANTEHPIIHRIVSITGNTIETKGDNNPAQLSVEKNISEDDIIGKAVFRIPKLGWIKLVFVEIKDALIGS